MPKYRNTVQDRSGNVRSGVAVTVYQAGTSTLATIYSDRAMSSVVAGSTLTTDADGGFQFFAPAGEYKVAMVGASGTAVEEDYVVQPTGNVAEHNVKDYGAIGDGVADDTAAIAAAYTAAVAGGGGKVRIPAGTWLYSTLTFASAAVLIEGAGPTATKLRTTATTGNTITIGNPAAPVAGGGIRDLTIDSAVARTAGYAIHVDGAARAVLDNLRIETTGGGGLSFAKTGTTTGFWFIDHVYIKVTGAFTGILIAGGNDRFFRNIGVIGNNTAGSKGIYVTGSQGDWFSDVSMGFLDKGVHIHAGAAGAPDINFPRFVNVFSDQCLTYGWHLDHSGGGTLNSILMHDCWAVTIGSGLTTSRGFLIDDGAFVSLQNARVSNIGGHGVEVTNNATSLLIGGGFFYGANLGGGGGSGIYLNGATGGATITGARCGPASAAQVYGIEIAAGSDNFAIVGNDLRGNVTAAVLNTPGRATSRVISANIGGNGLADDAPTIPARVAASADIDISSTTAADITGMTTTFTPTKNERLVLNASLFVIALTANVNSVLQVEAMVNGVAQAALLQAAPGTNNERITVGQLWTIDLTAGVAYTVKLQAKVDAAGATYRIKAAASGMVLERYAR